MAAIPSYIRVCPRLLQAFQWFPRPNRINARVLPVASTAPHEMSPPCSVTLSQPWITSSTLWRRTMIQAPSPTLLTFLIFPPEHLHGCHHFITHVTVTFSVRSPQPGLSCSLPFPFTLFFMALVTLYSYCWFVFSCFLFSMFYCRSTHENLSFTSFCSQLFTSVQKSVKQVEVHLIHFFIPEGKLNNCLLKSIVSPRYVKSILYLLVGWRDRHTKDWQSYQDQERENALSWFKQRGEKKSATNVLVSFAMKKVRI